MVFNLLESEHKVFVPYSIVSKCSVVSLKVIIGVFKTLASHYTPPESDITYLQFLRFVIKSLYPIGSIISILLNFSFPITFLTLGCAGNKTCSFSEFTSFNI